MRVRMIMFLISLAASIGFAETAGPQFQDAGKGYFVFDTGAVKGRLRADSASQGLVEFVDLKTGKDLASPSGPGLLSYYRLLSEDQRWGTDFRSWPKSAKRLADGAVEIHWPAADDHPVEMTAVYRWAAADTLDLETTVRPQRDLSAGEVFVSSYFNKDTRGRVYVQGTRHTGTRAPRFMKLDATPFTVGTYLAFPRDLRAARLIYDGRWEHGQSPVQFSVNRFHAAPIAIKHDPASGSSAVVMSRPEDCFSIEASYDQEQSPDGVAAHYSLYFSLFGHDLKAGQSYRAGMRMILGQEISDERAVRLYKAYAGL